MNKDQIIREISDYIKSKGGFPNEWYVGITNNAEDRLFKEHNVDKEKGVRIWRTANTEDEARQIERYFLEAVRTDGGPGGGSHAARQVYAYKKTWRTSP